jgi:hypothetical protein
MEHRLHTIAGQIAMSNQLAIVIFEYLSAGVDSRWRLSKEAI